MLGREPCGDRILRSCLQKAPATARSNYDLAVNNQNTVRGRVRAKIAKFDKNRVFHHFGRIGFFVVGHAEVVCIIRIKKNHEKITSKNSGSKEKCSETISRVNFWILLLDLAHVFRLVA